MTAKAPFRDQSRNFVRRPRELLSRTAAKMMTLETTDGECITCLPFSRASR